jgi:mono/diheme cytochrome c family protein
VIVFKMKRNLTGFMALSLAAISFLLAGCGSSDLTQVPVNPTTDGAALYSADCASCHGPLTTSSILGATAAQIQTVLSNKTGVMGGVPDLTTAQIKAIAAALRKH